MPAKRLGCERLTPSRPSCFSTDARIDRGGGDPRRQERPGGDADRGQETDQFARSNSPTFARTGDVEIAVEIAVYSASDLLSSLCSFARQLGPSMVIE